MLRKLLVILLILPFVSYNNVLSFGGKTHYQITRSAIINTKLLDHFPIEHRKKLKCDLLKSCNFPDNDTSNYITGFYSHFFNPDKGFDGLEEKDFTLINLCGNAFTSMYTDYLEAKELWRKGNQFESIDKLGRSIHYMQDMCCFSNQSKFRDDCYNEYIDTKVKENRTDLLHLLKLAMGHRELVFSDVRIIAMNYFEASLKSSIFRGCLPSDLSFAFEATCYLIDSFCRECGIYVVWT